MTAWVLLRGLTREAGHWGDFPQRLAAAGGTVLALDLPGNGVRGAEASPASVAGLAAACRAELAARGVGTPVRLVALSLGAMVALEWARQAPQELAGCALINTSLRGASPFWQRLRPRNYARLLRLLSPAMPAQAREALVLAMTSSEPARHAGVVERWAAIRRERPVSGANALRQLLAAARYTPPDRAPAVPLLVLASAGDGLVSPRCSRQLAARWQAPLRLHPSAGHDLPLDDPQWLVERLLDWREGLK